MFCKLDLVMQSVTKLDAEKPTAKNPLVSSRANSSLEKPGVMPRTSSRTLLGRRTQHAFDGNSSGTRKGETVTRRLSGGGFCHTASVQWVKPTRILRGHPGSSFCRFSPPAQTPRVFSTRSRVSEPLVARHFEAAA